METMLNKSPDTVENTKPCPFCAEDIRKEAVKCRFCGEFLDVPARPSRKKGKWYHTNTAIVISLLTLGPFALPIVWANPKYGLLTKVTITACTVIVTIGLCYILFAMVKYLIDQVQMLMP